MHTQIHTCIVTHVIRDSELSCFVVMALGSNRILISPSKAPRPELGWAKPRQPPSIADFPNNLYNTHIYIYIYIYVYVYTHAHTYTHVQL